MGAVEHASHFGWDTTARGLLDVYDRVLSQGKSARLNLAQ
jgi:D-inositol-3-phosphate glycosyltransferase